MKTLSDAITAVEGAQAGFTNASQTTVNDQATSDAIAAKLKAAQDTVTADQTAQTTAAVVFNASLADLIASANAAMIQVPAPAPVPAPVPTPVPVAVT